MSGPVERLSKITSHLQRGPDAQADAATCSYHALSPTSFLPRAAAIEPNAEAIVHVTATGAVLRRTYAEFAERACSLGYYLRWRGLVRVGIVAPNTPAFLESIFGIAAAGGVSVGVNFRLRSAEVQYILEHAQVDCVVVDAEFEHLLGPFAQANPAVEIIVDADDAGPAPGQPRGQFDEKVAVGRAIDAASGALGWAGLGGGKVEDENGLLALAYTSGTTARPKGVEFTHRGAYLASLGNVIESGLSFDGARRCRYLWTLPLFHACGWTFPWAVTAARGTHLCLRKINYPLIWKLLRTERVTHFNAAPTVNTLLCAAAEAERLPESVRVTVAGSAPSAHLFSSMAALNLEPVHVYGMTETYGPCTKSYELAEWASLDPDAQFANRARQGHGFITGLPVRVVRVDEETGGPPLAGDGATPLIEDVRKDGQEVGEIVFGGNICTRGYYDDPAATAKLFAGGVLHSGDLAVCHPDGAIQILDRQKDIIISGGENISSVALEGMLLKHPEVLEVGVAAVKDEQWGERPKAFVTVRDAKRGSITGDAIIEWAKGPGGVSGFMVPKEIEIVPELPKTATGKLQKNVLREWARNGRK